MFDCESIKFVAVDLAFSYIYKQTKHTVLNVVNELAQKEWHFFQLKHQHLEHWGVFRCN